MKFFQKPKKLRLLYSTNKIVLWNVFTPTRKALDFKHASQ